MRHVSTFLSRRIRQRFAFACAWACFERSCFCPRPKLCNITFSCSSFSSLQSRRRFISIKTRPKAAAAPFSTTPEYMHAAIIQKRRVLFLSGHVLRIHDGELCMLYCCSITHQRGFIFKFCSTPRPSELGSLLSYFSLSTVFFFVSFVFYLTCRVLPWAL